MVSLIIVILNQVSEMKNLIVDGMLSGTGIRDGIAGGYVSPDEIIKNEELKTDINGWRDRYAEEHYFQFENREAIKKLDAEGIELAKRISLLLPEVTVEYYSAAHMKRMPVI